MYGVREDGSVHRLAALEKVPADLAVLDLDDDGDDDVVTGGEELRAWINVQGRSLREAGESPYRLEAPIVALASGSLDERVHGRNVAGEE